ncbi:hypothetical protein JHK84_032056 [Glycine max]|nr:hypothetical protein JHK85_032482 [Glycine max]KAG5146513.1 hypothetical protein JHK84_032056 [Glycine max]
MENVKEILRRPTQWTWHLVVNWWTTTIIIHMGGPQVRIFREQLTKYKASGSQLGKATILYEDGSDGQNGEMMNEVMESSFQPLSQLTQSTEISAIDDFLELTPKKTIEELKDYKNVTNGEASYVVLATIKYIMDNQEWWTVNVVFLPHSHSNPSQLTILPSFQHCHSLSSVANYLLHAILYLTAAGYGPCNFLWLAFLEDLGVDVGLRLRDQSIKDAFMILETLLILTNVEMTSSCSIHKDLPVALKMLQRITD